MNKIIKFSIRKIIPKNFREKYWEYKQLKPYLDAFNTASEKPAWLGWDDFESLQKKYIPKSDYGYEAEDLAIRGEEFSNKILSLIGKDSVNVYKTLELGCFDGMVSYSLRKKGKNATAIDINSQRFDERAIREGVIFKKMDASSLEFPSDSFDCVFSFNAFEHFTNPALVLQEAARVTMKGGYVYSNFGPIYTSPYGLHTYRSIPIPYCQFLFPDEILDCVRAQKGVKPLAEHKKELNMLSLIDYRLIWKNCSNQLKRMYYQEVIDDSHLNLVKEYPNCFKSKTRYFDNLRVSSIEILFKKVK